ncbi:hypothetical protein ACFPM1_08245 [Halorubrum rubrum]|uniref:Uncharacterized protein n=1 Tax=Halorubrum rubrum TaxID=1126240 RepID=A0ABD5R1H9_9EURY
MAERPHRRSTSCSVATDRTSSPANPLPKRSSFGPAAVAVAPGTTVVRAWTGGGGDHDVSRADGAFESETVETKGYRPGVAGSSRLPLRRHAGRGHRRVYFDRREP